MPIRRKIQRDTTGCGLACVAMLARVTYDAVKLKAIALELLKKSGPFYTSSAALNELLRSFRIKSLRGRKVGNWGSIRSNAIVGINYHADSDVWHWVIYIHSPHGPYVLDPRAAIKSARRVDFDRMRLRSFIPVPMPTMSSKSS